MKTFLFLVSLVSSIVLFTTCNNQNSSQEDTVLQEDNLSKGKLSKPIEVRAESGPFSIMTIPFGYDELEPYIDAKTMEVHFSRHYLSYTNNLNSMVEKSTIIYNSIEELLEKLDPDSLDLRNNAGAYYNHNLYFQTLSHDPQPTPKGALEKAINEEFGSLEELVNELIEESKSRFGSGWTWLIVKRDGKLAITSTANYDNPLMSNAKMKGTPVLAIDLWEHAYYNKYQNKKSNYLTAFFKVLDWAKVSENYTKALEEL